MLDVSGDAACLLGPDGLAVECVALTEGEVRIVQLVTSDPDAARCPDSQAVSSSGKERVVTRPRDLPSGGGAVLLQWRKRLTTWIAKEQLRALCATAAGGEHRHQIRHRLWAFHSWCADADIPELTTLAETIETWWTAIEVFLTTGLTNART